MKKKIETEDAQNMVARMKEQIYLDIGMPSASIKKQFAKCEKAIVDLHVSLDLLNDMKASLRSLRGL